jgi:hypothetical protein
MKYKAAALGGLAGAVALNLLHEGVKRIDHSAPRIDLVGEEALTKIAKKTTGGTPTGKNRFLATLAADIFSNALYYSLSGLGKRKGTYQRSTALGLAAGIGALVVTPMIGLRDAPVSRTPRTKWMTVGYYLVGSFVAAGVMTLLDDRRKKGVTNGSNT